MAFAGYKQAECAGYDELIAQRTATSACSSAFHVQQIHRRRRSIELLIDKQLAESTSNTSKERSGIASEMAVNQWIEIHGQTTHKE